MSTYLEDVSQAFLHSDPATFGTSGATGAELGALRGLYRESGGNRDATLQTIVDEGYPMPTTVTAEMVALTGAIHACGVALHLAEIRGVEGKEATYESYTAKNRFDRFVSLHLPKDLRTEWSQPSPRESGFDNPTIEYPDGVDSDFIYGVAKPHRYFPAQTMRHLEFARLGKLDEKTKSNLLIADEADLSKFTIDWEELIPTIESATDTTVLAGNIGAQIASQLLKNGLNTQQVAAILAEGYSTRGVKQEHGNIPEANEVYSALLASLALSSETKDVADSLSSRL